MIEPTLSPAAAHVLALIRRQYAGTSLVEISNMLSAAGFDPTGDVTITHPSDPNLIIWMGASDLLADVLNELVQARLVHYQDTNPLVYAYDGGGLTLPIANRPPRQGYKSPHWLPIVVNAGPPTA